MEEKIKNVMSIVLEVPAEEIKEDSSFRNLENWDSLNHMKLIAALEEEFNIQLNEQDIIEMQSFKLIRHILSTYVKKASVSNA